MILTKYKKRIITIIIGIFITSVMLGYYLFERERILSYYKNASEDLVGFVNEHYKNDHVDTGDSFTITEHFAKEVFNAYSFAKQKYFLKKIVIFDRKGKVIFSNQSSDIGQEYISMKQVSGLDPEKTLVNCPSTLWFEDNANIDIDAYSPINHNETLDGYVMFLYGATSKTMFFLNYDILVVAILGAVLTILITLLISNLLRYNRTESQIQNEQKTLERMFDHASDGIIVLDQNRRVQMMNKAMEKMVGKKLDDFSSPIFCKHLLCCNHDGNQIGDHLCPARNKDKYLSTYFEFDIKNNVNETLNVSASVSDLKLDYAEGEYTIMLIRDETNRKKEEIQLEVLEEFEGMLNSKVEKENMLEFITQKVTALTGCKKVLVFEGNSYETKILLNQEEEEIGCPFIHVPIERNLIYQAYLSQRMQELNLDIQENSEGLELKNGWSYFVSLPLMVNDCVIGSLFLIFVNGSYLDKKKRVLLQKLSTNIAALMKVNKLIVETNEQRELNESLYKFGLLLQKVDISEGLSYEILEAIQEMVGCDFIAYRSQENRFTAWDSAMGNIHPMEHYYPQGDIMDYSYKWGRTLYYPNVAKEKDFDFNQYRLLDDEKLVTILSIPLIYNHKILGVMLFGAREMRGLTEEKNNLIKTIVNMISVQEENKSLYSQVENDATILERQRISREIHDGLAQNIGFITIQMHRLKKMLEKNQIQMAIQEIDVVKEAVDESYIELRETIDQLRDISGHMENLGNWLKKYAIEFEQTHRIKVEFEMRDMDKVILNDNQLVQITRVVQEVLNNIRKHSKASQVKVYLSGGKVLSLIIEDNGVGFDMMSLKRTKYSGHGLPILEERIRSINGDIHINSMPNQGTKVEIQVPMVG